MAIEYNAGLINRSLNVLDFQSHANVGEMLPCRNAHRPPVGAVLPEDEHQQIQVGSKVTLRKLESTYDDLCTVFRDIEDRNCRQTLQAEMTPSQLTHGEQLSLQQQSTRYFDQMVHFHCHKSPLFKVIFGRQRREYASENQKINMEVGDHAVKGTENMK